MIYIFSLMLGCSTNLKSLPELTLRTPASEILYEKSLNITNKKNQWKERVNSFINAGGAGVYVDAPNIQTEQGSLSYFYPNDIGAGNGKALFELFPAWKSNPYLNKILAELSIKKASIFIADTDEVGMLAAVVHNNYPSAKELIEKMGIEKTFILFLQPSASDDILIHEARHWLDSNDKVFFLNFYKILNENKKFLMGKSKVETQENYAAVESGFWEWRGHAEQLKYLKTKKSKAAKDEGQVIINKYTQTYWLPLRLQLSRLKKTNKSAFETTIKFLRDMEIQETPNELSYNTLFKNLE